MPVYVVCPRDGQRHSQTLHRNYLLPINPNIEQDEKDKPMAGVGNTASLTPVPPVDSVPADAGSSGTVTPSTAGSTLQHSLDQPALLRHSTKNHLELTSMEVPEVWFACRYWTNWHLGCIGWPVYLSAYCTLPVHCFLGKHSVKHTLFAPLYLCQAPLTSAFRRISTM